MHDEFQITTLRTEKEPCCRLLAADWAMMHMNTRLIFYSDAMTEIDLVVSFIVPKAGPRGRSK